MVNEVAAAAMVTGPNATITLYHILIIASSAAMLIAMTTPIPER